MTYNNSIGLSDNAKAVIITVSGIMAVVTVLCTLIIGLIYFEITSNENDMVMIEKYGIHPAVIKCLRIPWQSVQSFQICQQVLTSANISPLEADRLQEMLSDGIGN